MHKAAGAYPHIKKWGTNHGEREEQGAEGAEGVGCEEGVSPFVDTVLFPLHFSAASAAIFT